MTAYKTEPKIDAVICWVDGQDPDHQRHRAAYAKQAGDDLNSEVHAKRRWSYANELDICLRSIGRHAPWINKVFIVTNGQIPSGLDTLPRALFEKTQLITHSQIFNGYEDWLPCFNSMAIESMIWRIPNLSERFIYFNDDMFLAAPCQSQHFFQNDKTLIYGQWHKLAPQKVQRFKTSIYRAAKLNAAHAYGYKPQRFFSSAHIAIPMRVSALKHIFEMRPETLQYNAAQRFRGPDQYLVQGLFTHFILNHDQGSIVKRARFQNLSASYCKRVPFLLFWLNCQLFRLLPWRFRLICVNDLALLNQRFKGRAETILRRALGIS